MAVIVDMSWQINDAASGIILALGPN